MARPSSSGPWLKLVIPAKLIGFLAAAAACGAELASEHRHTMELAFLRAALPVWPFLAAVAAWDLAVLASLSARMVALGIESRLSAQPPQRTPEPDASENPVYREADVVVLEDRAKDPDHQ